MIQDMRYLSGNKLLLLLSHNIRCYYIQHGLDAMTPYIYGTEGVTNVHCLQVTNEH
jgi:hypothetical protein